MNIRKSAPARLRMMSAKTAAFKRPDGESQGLDAFALCNLKPSH